MAREPLTMLDVHMVLIHVSCLQIPYQSIDLTAQSVKRYKRYGSVLLAVRV